MWTRLSLTMLFTTGAVASVVSRRPQTVGSADRVAIERPQIVRIPSGEFTMGASSRDLAHAVAICAREPLSDHDVAVHDCTGHRLMPGARLCTATLFADERGTHSVWLAAYGIDRTEVTQQAYDACVRTAVCRPARAGLGSPSYGANEQPVVGVSWEDARTYCRWRGGRLPTEAEWERAARGRDARPFPWGVQYDPRRANHGGITLDCIDRADGFAGPAPVGSYPDGASPDGLLDMAGNVAEWTADVWDDTESRYPSDPAALRVAPQGASHGGFAIARGGAYSLPAYAMRTTFRLQIGPGARDLAVGFRCAYDVR